MTPEQADIAQQLAELRLEHRALDRAIHSLATQSGVCSMQLGRLKKRKLLLKDTIAHLASELIPDLDA